MKLSELGTGSLLFKDPARSSVSCKTRLSGLPSELRWEVLGHIQDIYTLETLFEAESSFRDTFNFFEESVSTRVLKEEIPPCLYTHAVVTQQALDDDFLMPNLQHIRIQDIERYVEDIPRARDAATSKGVSYAEAIAIHNTYLHVLELTHLFLEDFSTAPDEMIPGLQRSLRRRGPSPCEHIRIAQAIYLFQILASMTRQLTVDKLREDLYYSDYYSKIAQLQIQLTQRAVAPWEMHQVIGIKTFFMRVLNRLNKNHTCDIDLSLPYLMSRGVEFLCEVLCHPSEPMQDDFLKPFQHNSHTMPHHTLGVILSRGVTDTWTRKTSQPHSFAPFWPCEEDRMWPYIERKQRGIAGIRYGRHGFEVYSELIEARLDLWGTGLWDGERSDDIDDQLYAPNEKWPDVSIYQIPALLRSMASFHRRGLRTIV